MQISKGEALRPTGGRVIPPTLLDVQLEGGLVTVLVRQALLAVLATSPVEFLPWSLGC